MHVYEHTHNVNISVYTRIIDCASNSNLYEDKWNPDMCTAQCTSKMETVFIHNSLPSKLRYYFSIRSS